MTDRTDDKDDNLSAQFSVSSASQLSIDTTAYNTTGSVAATVTGDLDMDTLPLPGNQATKNRHSAIEPLTMSSVHGLGAISLPRDRNTSNSTFTGATTVIDEQHANYVLMYDMLTGIRISVSRCQAKPSRSICMEDFSDSAKWSFDSAGNEYTPSSKHDFKFKDYSPWVFRSLREAFMIDAADYLVSLTGRYVLSELSSPGKSGSLFYYSSDYRFIIKTIRKTEHEYLRRIMLHYYEHMRRNTNSLLTRFFGLHRVRVRGGTNIYFVVMGNFFPPNRDLHEIYDLKGAIHGRMTTDEPDSKRIIILKDLNWLKNNRKLRLGPTKATLLMNQIKSDCQFLCRMNIMDYSMLVGLHSLVRGNAEHLFDKTLAVVEPHATGFSHRPIVREDGSSKRLSEANYEFKSVSLKERSMCMFYCEGGGLRASYQDDSPSDEIYYLGIIDILTPYGKTKRFESFFKSIRFKWDEISAINPKDYAKRFVRFMSENILQNTEFDYTIKSLPPIPIPIEYSDGDEVLVEDWPLNV